MKITPLYDRIIVKRDKEKEQTTKSGLIIPDSAQDDSNQGTVVAVGEGRLQDDGSYAPLRVKEGDKVLLAKRSGIAVEVDNEELLVLVETEILGIIQ